MRALFVPPGKGAPLQIRLSGNNNEPPPPQNVPHDRMSHGRDKAAALG
jgi:hypothetical protein